MRYKENKNTHLRLASMTTDSVVDGPGLRTVIFTQGCSHACPGCHNFDIQNYEGGQNISVSELKGSILAERSRKLTISGGEPMEQPEALLELVKQLKTEGFNIWLYTGYTYDNIMSNTKNKARQDLANAVDVLVDGLFKIELFTLDVNYRGSSNQRLIDIQKTVENNYNIIEFKE